jgi:hypothetical protein
MDFSRTYMGVVVSCITIQIPVLAASSQKLKNNKMMMMMIKVAEHLERIIGQEVCSNNKDGSC